MYQWFRASFLRLRPVSGHLHVQILDTLEYSGGRDRSQESPPQYRTRFTSMAYDFHYSVQPVLAYYLLQKGSTWQ